MRRWPRTSVARPTHLTNFAKGAAHAQPADPRASLSTSVSLLLRPRSPLRIRHCDGYHTRRRSPPAGLATDRGRGSNPRGGTAAWSHPRRRGVPHALTEGGLLPLAPSGGVQPPFHAPRAPHLTSTTTRAHAQPGYTYPQSSPPHILLCLLVGRCRPRLEASSSPRCRCRCRCRRCRRRQRRRQRRRRRQRGRHHPHHHPCLRRRRRPPMPTPTPPAKAVAADDPPPRLHPSPPPATPLRRAPPFATAFTDAATQPTPHRPAATDPPCAPPSLSCFVCVL